MLNISQTFRRWEHLWQTKNVISWAFAWTALSLFIYIFFSGPAQGLERPFWYRIFTAYILQNVPTLVAGILCLRNGTSSRMPSGSQVWLLTGIALISYFLGNIFFSSWELVWHLNSTGSLGDLFFCIFYICLSLAMVMAIVSKRVQLKIYQWIIVVAIGIYAITIAMWILKPPANRGPATVVTPSVSIVQSQTPATDSANPNPAPSLPDPATEAPEWVMFFDGIFKPFGQNLNIFYVWCDVFLFTLAAVMILAFWGGRLSNAWQVNAQAIICYYIADMWFAYAGNHIKDYQAGFMLEVFWILGAIQFGVAAGIEFDHMLTRQKNSDLGESELFNN